MVAASLCVPLLIAGYLGKQRRNHPIGVLLDLLRGENVYVAQLV